MVQRGEKISLLSQRVKGSDEISLFNTLDPPPGGLGATRALGRMGDCTTRTPVQAVEAAGASPHPPQPEGNLKRKL